MKPFNFLGLLAVLFAAMTMMTLVGCDNECKDVKCQNTGTCIEDTGLCDCAVGYGGDLCENLLVNDYIGTWSANDQCDSGDLNYEVTITPSATVGEFLMTGFSAFDNPVISVRAVIVDDDNFEIPKGDYVGVSIEGTILGMVDLSATPNKIIIEYRAIPDNNGPIDNCALTLTKQ